MIFSSAKWKPLSELRMYFFVFQRWSKGQTIRSTPLNLSAFGVTLDSSVKSRPVQQTKWTSPGRLQLGVIICYNEIKWYVTCQCSAYHKTVVLDLVWTTDPGNSSAVGNGEEALETGENMGGAVQRSVAQSLTDKVSKFWLLLNFINVAFKQSKENHQNIATWP